MDDINRFHSASLSEQELLEMAIVTYKYTGIEHVVLWVGPNPESPGQRRIAVSNMPNKYDGRDCFTLTIPEYEIIGKVDNNVITKEILSQIKQWCDKNMQVIIEYSDYEISTADLLLRSKPI